MMHTNADTFRETLQQMEVTKDVSKMVAFFHEDATVDTPAHEQKLIGHAAIETFWREYLHAFGSVRSTFTVERTIGDTSILEWTSEGALPTGKPIKYRGVTILTFKGYKIATFTAYYDSAMFIAPAEAAAPVASLTTAVGAINNEGGD